MREVKEPMAVRAQHVYNDVCKKLPKSRLAVLIFGFALSLAFGGVVALWNISSGPLHNLNDIGSWNNRLLFILMTAAVQTALGIGYGVWILRHKEEKK